MVVSLPTSEFWSCRSWFKVKMLTIVLELKYSSINSYNNVSNGKVCVGQQASDL